MSCIRFSIFISPSRNSRIGLSFASRSFLCSSALISMSFS